MDQSQVEIHFSDGEKPNTKKVTVEFILPSDSQYTKNIIFGKKRQTCKICNATGDFEMMQLPEMFFGTKELFYYFVCSECECLQIETFPPDMEKYYPQNYYSYGTPNIVPVQPGMPRDTRMILDVGCGAGNWLCFLASNGCVNLYGCDPFIENDLSYSNGVKIKKCSIHEMDGKYDVIRLSESFEHMPDPHDVFESLNRLLKNNTPLGKEKPKIEISIPTWPRMAFNIYGVTAVSLDPPRHFFMYTHKAIKYMAEKHGLYISDVKQYSHREYILCSRLYQLGETMATAGSAIMNNKHHVDINKEFEIIDTLVSCAKLTNQSEVVEFVLQRK